MRSSTAAASPSARVMRAEQELAPRASSVMTIKPHDSPSDVTAEEGEVVVDGPGGVALSFTPEAAAETSDRLLQGAMAAKGQEVGAKARRKPV